MSEKRACPIQKPILLDPQDPGATADAIESGLIVDGGLVAWFPCVAARCAAFTPGDNSGMFPLYPNGKCKCAGGFAL